MKYRILLILIGFQMVLFAQHKPSQKWLDQKFSMFIHFGIYSQYGGVYNGAPVKRGYSEQIQSFAGIFSDWYAQKAQEFNPTKWNSDSIVELAKSAGMKSIVFTSKHHDGFCMFNSEYTNFDIVEATPYAKDIMKELSEACLRGGIGFSVYFSLIDWHFPQAYPISSHNADPITPKHHTYNLAQVEEIMTNYGKISEIWFDMGALTQQQSKELYDLVSRLQPECMISGRLGNNFGDFAVMADNEYPNYKMGVPWQTAASIFDETWGYRSWQERGSVEEKIHEKIKSLVKVVSGGGNFLLNIGTKGDGSVVEFEYKVLKGIGKWVDKNAEAIYATQSNPFNHNHQWGEVTKKDDNLFLFVNRDYAGKSILLNGFTGLVKKVEVLKSKEPCKYSQNNINNNECVIKVPESSNKMPYIVLKVSFKDGFRIIPPIIIDENEFLTSHNALPTFSNSGINYYGGYKSLIAYNWNFQSNKQTVKPTIFFTDNERGRKINFIIDNEKIEIKLDSEEQVHYKVPKHSIRWGRLFQKAGRGVFGYLEEEKNGNKVTEFNDSGWKRIKEFEYERQHTLKVYPRQSVVFLQEIFSDFDQEIPVKIESGNALYVLLNGKYITAHFLPKRIKSQNELIVLPLKKGYNQLVLKFYNGFEKEMSYGIYPLKEWNMYVQKIPQIKLESVNIHSLMIKDRNPSTIFSPLKMNNIKVKL